MGFDEGRDKTIVQQVPDFKKTLEDYHKRVEEMGADLKARSDELASVLAKLNQAKADLQAQYDKTVDSLGGDIKALQLKITDLQAQSDTLSKEIQDKQALKNAISLDNSKEQERLDSSWVEFHKAFDDYQTKVNEVNWAQESLFNANAQLEKAKDEFVKYKASTIADLDQKTALANTLMDDAKAKQADGISALQRVNDALTDLAQKKANLDEQIMKAQPLIDQAEDVRTQTEYNKTTQATNDAQALQNQKDAEQIKVARVALNNLKHELDAREATISAAEHNIGGK